MILANMRESVGLTDGAMVLGTECRQQTLHREGVLGLCNELFVVEPHSMSP